MFQCTKCYKKHETEHEPLCFLCWYDKVFKRTLASKFSWEKKQNA